MFRALQSWQENLVRAYACAGMFHSSFTTVCHLNIISISTLNLSGEQFYRSTELVPEMCKHKEKVNESSEKTF
jgi:hypothetical protein